MQDILDSDIFKADKKTVSVEKVLTKIWGDIHIKNSPKTKFYLDLLSYFIDEPRVLKDVEFYLPQIAHATILASKRVEETNREHLDRFIILLCQSSIHIALQLTFIFTAALEDYQPKARGDILNPTRNSVRFNRCAKLIQDIERAVIFGSKVLSIEEEKALKKQLNTNDDAYTPTTAEGLHEVKKSEVAKRLSIARDHLNFDDLFNGILFFKRVDRLSNFKRKGWNQRFFVVDNRILYCFKEEHSVNPKRILALENCKIEVFDDDHKYANTLFHIINYANSVKFQLRAENQQLRDKWVSYLRIQISGAPQVDMGELDNSNTESNSPREKGKPTPILNEKDLTGIQRKRFNHFKQSKALITNLTNICERLRFKDREVRKFFLKNDMKELAIPPLAYLPLCNSIDPYCTILRALPNEGHAFNTKARCPALMIFEMQTHPIMVDTASFLGMQVELFEEDVVINKKSQELAFGVSSPTWDAEQSINEATHDNAATDVVKLDSIFSKYDKLVKKEMDYHMFVSANTGFKRLSAHGFKLPKDIQIDTTKEHEQGSFLSRFLGPKESNTTNTTTASTSNDNSTKNTPIEVNDITIEMQSVLTGETFHQKEERLKKLSPYGHLPGWKLGGLIAKSNDDVRQEVFVMQLIRYYQNAFAEAKIPAWLFTYTIMNTSQSTGLIQLIPDANSLDGLKKSKVYPGSLRKYFEHTYGYIENQPETPAFRNAMNNYISSMAGYSIVCYLLAIKDRHNGNIMIDNKGHIVHIDFGFVFGLAPGKAFSMETAPWKLTPEMVEVFGGVKSSDFLAYVKQCSQALLIARKHFAQVKTLIDIMGTNSSFPSFKYNSHALKDFENRLVLDIPDQKVEENILQLIKGCLNHTGTSLYDRFQLATNGIAP